MTTPTPDSGAMSTEELRHILDNALVAFGLDAQGHIPTVERMLAQGYSWELIGKAINWCPESAREHYMQFLSKPAAPPAPTRAEMDLPNAEGLWFLDGKRWAFIEHLHGGQLAVCAWNGILGARYPTLGTRVVESLPRGGWLPAQADTAELD